MNIVIYGAQGVALGAYKAIKTLFPNKEVQCFLVTERGNNASTLGDIPVRELAEFSSGLTQDEKDNTEVLIGTIEADMDIIEESLDQEGLYCHVRLDSIRWAQMQQMAFAKTGEYMPLAAYPVGFHRSAMHVYKMVNHKDQPLKMNYQNPDYMITLQVGAVNADKSVASLVDNLGDNISNKNDDYSELTGLYWIWKNQIEAANEAYYGLAHYRRILGLSKDDELRLMDNGIDVVLPYPMPYEPNIEAHHERYLSPKEWLAVLQAIEELQPEYAVAFKDVLEQGYLYNYNIILAKGNVLNDYCSWLFPILFRVEQIVDPEGIIDPHRYIGYTGETLETLYFMYNKQRLKIAHTECRFLI